MVIAKSVSKYLVGSAAIALAVPAVAQTNEQKSSDNIHFAVGEIVVTAQRRQERAQDVPISISAFSGERLSQMNVDEAQDLYGKTPSLVVGSQGQASRDVQSFTIRGQSTGFLSAPAVAQYFAEVPLPSAVTLALQGAPGLFIDLENVQVLSGPQGTLFGRNTTGGAVLFVPRKPTEDFEGYVEGGYGNYDFKAVEAAINIPLISDKLLVRIVGAFQDRDGFTKDLIFDKKRDDLHWYSGRVSVLVRPSENLESLTLFYGSKSSNNGAGYIHDRFNIEGLKGVGFCADPGEVFGPNAVQCDVYRRQTEIAEELGPRKTRLGADAFSVIKLWGISNTTSFEINDSLTLRNIISFHRLRDNYGGDQDATPLQQYEQNQTAGVPGSAFIPGLAEFGLPLMGYLNGETDHKGYRDDIEQFTEELQLQGRSLDGKLNYTVGAFHYNARPGTNWTQAVIDYCPALFTGLCEFGQSVTGVSNKSNALYAQGTLDFGAFAQALEELRLTAGYRYTWDEVKGFASIWRPNSQAGVANCLEGGLVPNPAVPLADVMTVCYFDASLKSKGATWTVGLDYKPVSNLMIYGKISKGYKAGGFNTLAVRPEARIFRPEELTSYELGFKSDWRIADMPVRLNATYYYSDYKNIQRPTGDYNPATGAAGVRILEAVASIQGVELEASVRPLPGFEIGGNFSHTDADYKKFEQTVFAPTVACGGLSLPGELADFSCMPFQFATPYIYSVYASLDIPVPENWGNVSAFLNYSHVSRQATAPMGNAQTQSKSVLEAYGLLSASVTWAGVASLPLDVTVFGNNLTNKLYRIGNSNTINDLLVNSSLYGTPRMYGVKVRYSF